MWNSVAVLLVVVSNSLQLAGSIDVEENLGPRIVNGTNAKDGEFPFIASLRRIVNATAGSHSCGCSIISNEWLLTAAHCVAGKDPSSISIQYGVTEIASTGPTIATVKKIIVHEYYDPLNDYINDIALVHLSIPLTFNDFIKTIKLPQQGQTTKGGSNAVLVGWGLNSTSGTIQTHLQKVDLITYSDEDCRRLHNNSVHFTNICAGVIGGGKGQCNGDSGGPLLVNEQQVGVVSWSVKPCTIAPYPGVLTKVAEYVNWIRENMNLTSLIKRL